MGTISTSEKVRKFNETSSFATNTSNHRPQIHKHKTTAVALQNSAINIKIGERATRTEI